MTYQLIDNTEAKRYEFDIEGKKPIVEYIKIPGKIYLTHTEVPASLQGQGIATTLIKAVLEEVEKNDWELIPLCPMIATYIKNNPEWRKLVLKGINIA